MLSDGYGDCIWYDTVNKYVQYYYAKPEKHNFETHALTVNDNIKPVVFKLKKKNKQTEKNTHTKKQQQKNPKKTHHLVFRQVCICF